MFVRNKHRQMIIKEQYSIILKNNVNLTILQSVLTNKTILI